MFGSRWSWRAVLLLGLNGQVGATIVTRDNDLWTTPSDSSLEDKMTVTTQDTSDKAARVQIPYSEIRAPELRYAGSLLQLAGSGKNDSNETIHVEGQSPDDLRGLGLLRESAPLPVPFRYAQPGTLSRTFSSAGAILKFIEQRRNKESMTKEHDKAAITAEEAYEHQLVEAIRGYITSKPGSSLVRPPTINERGLFTKYTRDVEDFQVTLLENCLKCMNAFKQPRFCVFEPQRRSFEASDPIFRLGRSSEGAPWVRSQPPKPPPTHDITSQCIASAVESHCPREVYIFKEHANELNPEPRDLCKMHLWSKYF